MPSLTLTDPLVGDLLPKWYPAVHVSHERDDPPVYKPLTSANRYRLWQPNDHDTTCVLALDLDTLPWLIPMMETIKLNPGLRPSYLIEKNANGHGQAGWFIPPVSHGPNSHEHPQVYARAVRQALTNAFGGDQAFTNTRCWNPCWKDLRKHASVWWGPTSPRSLGELMTALKDADLWNPDPPGSLEGRPSAGTLADYGSRNCWVFNATRLRRSGTVREVAHALNDALSVPMSRTEVEGIIRSIERWEAAHGGPRGLQGPSSTSTPSQAQRRRGALGGSRNTDAQREARRQGPAAAAIIRSSEAITRAAAIREMKSSGMSHRQIAEALGISRDTVRRAVRGGSS